MNGCSWLAEKGLCAPSQLALLAALRRTHRDNDAGQVATVYLTSQAHSSVEKATRIAGVDPGCVRLIDVAPSPSRWIPNT